MSLHTPALGDARDLDPRLVATLTGVVGFGATALLFGHAAATVLGVLTIVALLTILVGREGASAFDRAWIAGRHRVATRRAQPPTFAEVVGREVSPLLPPQD